MTGRFFKELSRRLREIQIETAQSEENRLDVLFNGRPVLFVSPSGDVFHLPAGDKQLEVSELFATMSSDEFKIGKKIPLLVMRRGIKCDIQKLDSQLLNNIA